MTSREFQRRATKAMMQTLKLLPFLLMRFEPLQVLLNDLVWMRDLKADDGDTASED